MLALRLSMLECEGAQDLIDAARWKAAASAGAALWYLYGIVWYGIGGVLIASMAAAAPRRRRRDALGATRAGRCGWRSRRTALVAGRAVINYGSFTRLVYSAATSRVKIHCVWW